MTWREILFLVCTLILSVALLALFHYTRDPDWIKSYLPATTGGDGVLWQVQTTFLSVGFAGLAIAAQLFAEAPLAIGASRARVPAYVHAGWFVGVGLVANAVIGIESIWLPSSLGVLAVSFLWFTPTVALLVVSTVKLMRLFGRPSQLDEVVRLSLVQALSNRLEVAASRYVNARRQLESLVSPDWPVSGSKSSPITLRVPVPEVGRVVKAIKPKVVQQAIGSLGPRASEDPSTSAGDVVAYTPPQIALETEPGDRTRLGQTAFRVITPERLDEKTQKRIVRLLQSSIEFEASESVTPDEETDREIASLKDAIGMNLRSGAHSTAKRALDLLGQVVQGVWVAGGEGLDSSRRASLTRRDWLFRSIGEVEQDALLSPRAAGMFVSAAMDRALEAPRTGSTDYVDECFRSFTRLWFDVLRHGDGEFDAIPSRIIVCVQNLAEYSYSTSENREDLQARATWAMVELVKLAIDAKRFDDAKLAAEELGGLFEFDRQDSGRAHVRGGQLVLSGWLRYLAEKGDDRDPDDPELFSLVATHGTWAEIISGRNAAERSAAPSGRWDWWEFKATPSRRAQALELSHYIDRAQLAALASSRGVLPPANDQQTASDYTRLLTLLTDGDGELSAQETGLRERLTKEIADWDAAEDERLALEPISNTKVEAVRTSLQDSLADRDTLASLIPLAEDIPSAADLSRPILGMNFRVPRHYLVEKVFNQTYADPKDLGEVFARGFTEGEDQKVMAELRSLQSDVLEPTVSAIRQVVESLEGESEHYVLVTPYGGLDVLEWYSAESLDTLARITHVETGVLDGAAALFDRRSTLVTSRTPEEKEGLTPVEGTTIALGVFEDVEGTDDPQVRIETGEFFVVWAGDDPRVFRFGTEPSDDDAAELEDEAIESSTG